MHSLKNNGDDADRSRIRLGDIAASLATLDLCVAVHRGYKDRAEDRVLHPIHRDEPLHHLRHGHRRVLRSCHDNDNPLLANLEGDEEMSEVPAKLAGRQARHKQAQQLEVVTNTYNCFSLRTCRQHITKKSQSQPLHKRDGNTLLHLKISSFLNLGHRCTSELV
jgi:hypothetical protein